MRSCLALLILATPLFAQDTSLKPEIDSAKQSANTAWMMVATALVMLMMPGLALFYGGMARRKNVLGTMMHTMVALGLVGVQWVLFGYAIAFGDSVQTITLGETEGSLLGFSPELVGLDPAAAAGNFKTFPGTDCPLYLHAIYQGMFAIITVALVSGAFAERVKFGAYLLFSLLWTTLVYDPLAHWVWSAPWKPESKAGWLSAMGALDFAGGTVVHIAAGVSGLAAILLLRKRRGYGKHPFHPNSMVLTLLGAGLLWFGWFGFNGGSAVASNGLAVSALAVTQVAAAAAGMAWLLVEWLHRGKPTALGFASGVVAGLVAITPASGFVAPLGALAIGGIAGVACYWSVAAKSVLKYDDSLDAFGIHGVGGFLGAVLTGAFCSVALWRFGSGSAADAFPGAMKDGAFAQVQIQLLAAVTASVYAFIVTAVLVVLIEKSIGFTCDERDEAAGLDLSQHGEVGFDVGPEVEAMEDAHPRAAAAPPVNGGHKRFTVVVEGAPPEKLIDTWSKFCQSGDEPPVREFASVYPYFTTVSGNKFRFRGGDPAILNEQLRKLFENSLNANVKTHVEL